MDAVAERPIAASDRALARLFVRDLVLEAMVGVHPHEHGRPQRVRISIDLGVVDEGTWALPQAPVQGDVLSGVVDYAAVVEQVRRIVSAGHVALVETLAERIAMTCLIDSRVRRARVRVEKLDAIDGAASVGVEIERCNRDR